MILFILCIILFLVGLFGVIVKRNLLKIVISMAIMQYSVNLFLILVGFIKSGRAPIIVKGLENTHFVDPLPQAMVLTAIVIGFAATPLLLAVAVMIYKKNNTFDVRKIKNLKG